MISSAGVSQDILTALYKSMLKIRLAEEKIVEIYPTDAIQSPVHLCIGQEAISAGVCLALEKTDHIYGTYRGHGIYIAKGGGMKPLFAELYAKETGCSRGKGGSMHVVAPEVGVMGCSAIVASTIPLAVGDALAAKMRGSSRLNVAFFGDGAVEEGVFFESLNFAALKNLPVIFVCENNNYAVHSRVSDRRKQLEIFRLGESLGVPGSRHDGNDAPSVYSAMKQAVEKTRQGGGPLLLEFMTYRLYEHVGVAMDHEVAYREKDKLDQALKTDPLLRAEALLKKSYGVSNADFDQWKTAVSREIGEAVKFAEESSFPSSDQLYEDLFEVKPWG